MKCRSPLPPKNGRVGWSFPRWFKSVVMMKGHPMGMLVTLATIDRVEYLNVSIEPRSRCLGSSIGAFVRLQSSSIPRSWWASFFSLLICFFLFLYFLNFSFQSLLLSSRPIIITVFFNEETMIQQDTKREMGGGGVTPWETIESVNCVSNHQAWHIWNSSSTHRLFSRLSFAKSFHLSILRRGLHWSDANDRNKWIVFLIVDLFFKVRNDVHKHCWSLDKFCYRIGGPIANTATNGTRSKIIECTEGAKQSGPFSLA